MEQDRDFSTAMVGSNEIKAGFCKCGCGSKTNLAKQTDNKRGIKRGDPFGYVYNHHLKNYHHMENNNFWRGGKMMAGGYKYIRSRSEKRYVSEHVLMAESVLGKPLPINARVHHIDGNKLNNSKNNLVVCENESYHQILHQRLRANNECGNPNYRACKYCGIWDEPDNMEYTPANGSRYHSECRRKYQRDLYARNKKKYGVGRPGRKPKPS